MDFIEALKEFFGEHFENFFEQFIPNALNSISSGFDTLFNYFSSFIFSTLVPKAQSFGVSLFNYSDDKICSLGLVGIIALCLGLGFIVFVFKLIVRIVRG